METYLTWFGLFLKEQLHRKSYIVGLFTMCLAIITVALIRFPTAENTKIGYCYEGHVKDADWMDTKLEHTEDFLTYQRCVTSEEMIEQVLSGAIDSGFVISETADKIKVECIFSPVSTKGMLAKQTLIGIFYKKDSLSILKEADTILYTASDANRLKQVLEKNESYQNSDAVFDVSYVFVEQPKEAVQEKRRNAMWVTTILFNGCMLLYSMYMSKDSKTKGFLYALPRRKRMLAKGLYATACVVLSGSVSLVLCGLVSLLL